MNIPWFLPRAGTREELFLLLICDVTPKNSSESRERGKFKLQELIVTLLMMNFKGSQCALSFRTLGTNVKYNWMWTSMQPLKEMKVTSILQIHCYRVFSFGRVIHHSYWLQSSSAAVWCISGKDTKYVRTTFVEMCDTNNILTWSLGFEECSRWRKQMMFEAKKWNKGQNKVRCEQYSDKTKWQYHPESFGVAVVTFITALH